MTKQQINLEYSFNCPIKIVFDRVAYASGLSEWYANDVNVNNDIYSFIWDDYKEDYKLISRKLNKSIIFESTSNKEYFIEFILSKSYFAETTLLNINVDVDISDVDDISTHFDLSIKKLKSIIGSI